MNVTCQDCRSVFRVDPAKVPPNGVRARCSVCGAIVRITVGAVTPLTSPAISQALTPLQASVVSGATPMGLPALRRATPATTDPVTPNLPYPSRPTPSIATPAIQVAAATFAAASLQAVEAGKTSMGAQSETAGAPMIAMPEPVAAAAIPAADSATVDAIPERLAALEFLSLPESGTLLNALPELSTELPPAPGKEPLQPVAAALPTPPAAPIITPVMAPVFARPLVPPPPPSPGQLVGMTAPTPATSAPAVSPPVSDQRRVINPFLRSDPMTRAKRLARALVSDMVAYQPVKRAEGLANGTLKQLFRDEIRKSYDEYVEQVGRDVAESTAFFQDALNEVLAEGKRVF